MLLRHGRYRFCQRIRVEVCRYGEEERLVPVMRVLSLALEEPLLDWRERDWPVHFTLLLARHGDLCHARQSTDRWVAKHLRQRESETSRAPATVFREASLVAKLLRDLLTDDYTAIRIDDAREHQRIIELLNRIMPAMSPRVRLHDKPYPIFEEYGVQAELDKALKSKVWLKSGGSIVINQTEALVAIDVNTGRHKGGKDQEQTILKVNLESAEEICRQLRLRNMGGLIVLDFIDMKGRRDQQQVYQRVKDGLRRDKAKTHILPISQLGLMEMTRQRHSESTRSAVYDDCPYCKGRGKVKSAVTMSVEIQRKLGEIMKKRERDESDFQLKILVHPTVLTRLNTEDRQLITDLEKRYYGKLTLKSEPGLHAEEFRIVNGVTNEELARA